MDCEADVPGCECPAVEYGLSQPNNDHFLSKLGMLAENSATVTSLVLPLTVAEFGSHRIERLLFSTFSNLTSLSITILSGGTMASEQGPLHFDFNQEYYPVITTLTLDGLVLMPRGKRPLATLRSLHLRNYRGPWPLCSLPSFIDTLNTATQLTTLTLDSYLSYAVPSAVHAPLDTLLHIPHLDRLIVRDTPRLVAAFTAHIRPGALPRDTQLAGLWNAHARLDVLAPFAPLLAPAHIPHLADPAFAAARVELSKRAAFLDLAAPGLTGARLTLAAECAPPRSKAERAARADTILRGPCELLQAAAARGTGLAALELAGALLAHAEPRAWADVLCCAPALRVLSVVDAGPGDGVRSALYALARATVGEGAEPLCPALDVVRLHGLVYDAALTEFIEGEVRARGALVAEGKIAKGLRRLEMFVKPEVVSVPMGGTAEVLASKSGWPERFSEYFEEVEVVDLVPARSQL